MSIASLSEKISSMFGIPTAKQAGIERPSFRAYVMCNIVKSLAVGMALGGGGYGIFGLFFWGMGLFFMATLRPKRGRTSDYYRRWHDTQKNNIREHNEICCRFSIFYWVAVVVASVLVGIGIGCYKYYRAKKRCV
jgi:hypothetical protein